MAACPHGAPAEPVAYPSDPNWPIPRPWPQPWPPTARVLGRAAGPAEGGSWATVGPATTARVPMTLSATASHTLGRDRGWRVVAGAIGQRAPGIRGRDRLAIASARRRGYRHGV